MNKLTLIVFAMLTASCSTGPTPGDAGSGTQTVVHAEPGRGVVVSTQQDPNPEPKPGPRAEVVDLDDVLARRAREDRSYVSFLRSSDLSTGVYFLAKGSRDNQNPHDQDEIYHVLSGRAKFQVDGEDHPVGPGSVIFVPKHVEHRFVEIEEDLSTLVFFATSAEQHRRK